MIIDTKLSGRANKRNDAGISFDDDIEQTLSLKRPFNVKNMDEQRISFTLPNRNSHSNQINPHDLIKEDSMSLGRTSRNSSSRPQSPTPLKERVDRTANHKPLLPHDTQAPLFFDHSSNEIKETIQIGKWDTTTKKASLIDVVTSSDINDDTSNLPIVAGKVLNMPKIYRPAIRKGNGKKNIFSNQEMNLMLMHVSRIGNVNIILGDSDAVMNISKSPYINVNITDDEGKTPLIFASLGGHDECVRVLLLNGSLIQQSDHTGRTALHWAAKYGRTKIVKRLLKSGGKILTEDYQGKTAIHCATESESVSTLRAILRYMESSQDINCIDYDFMTPLMTAAFYGHHKHIKLLLKYKANVFKQDIEGKSALHFCSSNNHVRCAALLLSSNNSLFSLKDIYGRNTLHLACQEGNISIVYYLISRNPSILNSVDNVERTPLHWASICGKTAIVKLLCEFGAKLNKPDKHLTTPLIYASKTYLDCVHILLRKGASVSCKDENGKNALIWASQEGNIEIVKLLLTDVKSNINEMDQNGMRPLHFAAQNGYTLCCVFLIRNNADLIAKDYKSQSPIFKAASSGHSETVLALINEGANISEKDITGRTPLHITCSAGHLDVANILVSNGANVNCVDLQKTTPLHDAAFSGRSDVLNYLISRGADVNCIDSKRILPLHYACLNGHINCCRILLSHESQINVMTLEYDTPLDYAILNNHTEIAEFLAGHNAVSGKTILVTAVTIIQQFWRKRRSKIPQKTKLPDLSTNNIIKQIENMHFNKLSKESLHPKESREHNVMDNQL